MRRLFVAVTAFLVLTGFGSGERFFAPGIDLWERWTAHDATATKTIDHSPWDGLLQRYVEVREDGANLVRYGEFSDPDRAVLQTYLEDMSGVEISTFSRPEQLAFWTNVYNALTVMVVLDHMPVESIRDIDISPGLFSNGPWGATVFNVEGEDLYLNAIEHRILRPIWNDPRIHYVLNCGSIGCPDLAARAYTGQDIDTRLDQAARSYVNDPRGVSIRNDLITVSKIYDWFIGDFGGSEEQVIAHLRAFADTPLLAELERIGDLHDTAYDWSLNGARADR